MITILNFKDKETFHKLERQAYDGVVDATTFPPAEVHIFARLPICMRKK
jgi:hypothetical protein